MDKVTISACMFRRYALDRGRFGDCPRQVLYVANTSCKRRLDSSSMLPSCLGVYHPLLRVRSLRVMVVLSSSWARGGISSAAGGRAYEERVRFDVERAKHWLGVGAQVSDRVRRFFVQEGLLEQLPRPPQTKKNKPKAKALERLKKASSSAEASS